MAAGGVEPDAAPGGWVPAMEALMTSGDVDAAGMAFDTVGGVGLAAGGGTAASCGVPGVAVGAAVALTSAAVALTFGGAGPGGVAGFGGGDTTAWEMRKLRAIARNLRSDRRLGRGGGGGGGSSMVSVAST